MRLQLVVALLLSLLALTPQVRAETLIAIYPLRGKSLDKQTRTQLDQLLRGQAEALPGLIVQSSAKTSRAIARVSNKRGDCRSRMACLIEVGEVTAANFLIHGSVFRADDAFKVELTLLDIVKESIVKRVSGALQGDAKAITAQMRELVVKLVLPEQFAGTLVVSMLVPGARVLLDGLEVGVTPMEPLGSLTPRDYKLGLVLEGCKPFSKMVSIHPGATTMVLLETHGQEISAKVERQGGGVASGPVPKVARALAAKLRQALRTPSQVQTVTEPVKEVVASPAPPPPAPQAPPLQDISEPPSDETTPPVTTYASYALIGGGAVASVIAAVGLGAWSYATLRMDDIVQEGLVTDTAAYNDLDSDRDLYQGLGLAGAVALPLGLASLGGGIALFILSQDGNASDAGDDDGW